jgi:hypothetical protein
MNWVLAAKIVRGVIFAAAALVGLWALYLIAAIGLHGI